MDYETVRMLVGPLMIAALWGLAALAAHLLKKTLPDNRVTRFLFKSR
jgi:hypothetical protein